MIDNIRFYKGKYLSKQYENPTGKDRTSKKFKELKDNMSPSLEDVNGSKEIKQKKPDGNSVI